MSEAPLATLSAQSALEVLHVGILTVLDKCSKQAHDIAISDVYSKEAVDAFMGFTLESLVKMLYVISYEGRLPVPDPIIEYCVSMGWTEEKLLGPLYGALGSQRPAGSALH